MSHRPLWFDAAALAARAHRHQVRRDGRTPYAAHPSRVALTLAAEFGCTDEHVLAAAFLHDVIEDCGIDYDEVSADFGAAVADLVAVVSKDPRVVEPEREARYDAALAAGPWQGRMIKLADVYDNLRDARGAKSQRKLLEKAERALALAAGDAELTDASAKVRALVRAVEAELG